MDKHGDVGVGGRHAVEEGGGGGMAGGLGEAGRGHELAQQHRAAGRGHGVVQRLQLRQHVLQMQQPLLQHLNIKNNRRLLVGYTFSK